MKTRIKGAWLVLMGRATAVRPTPNYYRGTFPTLYSTTYRNTNTVGAADGSCTFTYWWDLQSGTKATG